ncbi:hypothetical protein ACWD3J_17235 [Streptomyces sp. NPDC002755]
MGQEAGVAEGLGDSAGEAAAPVALCGVLGGEQHGGFALGLGV